MRDSIYAFHGSISHVSSYATSVLEALFGGWALVVLALYFYVIYPCVRACYYALDELYD